MARRILVVEDNREIADLVALHLRDLGCEVDVDYDGASGSRDALSPDEQQRYLDLPIATSVCAGDAATSGAGGAAQARSRFRSVLSSGWCRSPRIR